LGEWEFLARQTANEIGGERKKEKKKWGRWDGGGAQHRKNAFVRERRNIRRLKPL